MNELVACVACHRHIRVEHDKCPFCGVTVPADFAKGIVGGPRGRLDRLATFTFAATAAAAMGVSTLDCSTSATSVTPLYGAPVPVEDGGGDAAGKDGSIDDGSVNALYGAPVLDAASDADDASVPDGGSVQPAYGLPVDASID